MRMLFRLLRAVNLAFSVTTGRRLALYNPTKYLLIEKSKFVVAVRPNFSVDELRPEDVTVDNSSEAWDSAWGNSRIAAAYHSQERIAFYSELAARICRLIVPGHVLDVGCGSGALLKHVLSLRSTSDFQFFGVDFSEKSIEECRRAVPGVDFRVGDIYQIPLPDGFASSVICTEVLEHLMEPRRALQELLRVCGDGGRLFVTVPNGDVDGYYGHVNFWSLDDFKSFLGSVDCSVSLIEKKRSLLAVVQK